MANQALEELISYLEGTAASRCVVWKKRETACCPEDRRAAARFRPSLSRRRSFWPGWEKKRRNWWMRVGGELGEEIAGRLDQFSMSASTALRIGSVFFMTALAVSRMIISRANRMTWSGIIEELKGKALEFIPELLNSLSFLAFLSGRLLLLTE